MCLRPATVVLTPHVRGHSIVRVWWKERFIDDLQNYAERWPNELDTVARFLRLAEEWPDCLKREHLPGHVTASAWVVDGRAEAVLLLHHRKIGRRLQPGGHADGDPDLRRVALRELGEETGLTGSIDRRLIFDIDIHTIPPWNGAPRHLHYDVRFLVRTAARPVPRANDESEDVGWFALDRVTEWIDERSIERMVEKTQSLFG